MSECCNEFNKVLVVASLENDQSLTAVATATIQFQVETIDSSDSFDPTTHIFTAPNSGIYEVVITATTLGQDDNSQLGILLKKMEALTFLLHTIMVKQMAFLQQYFTTQYRLIKMTRF